MRVELTEVYVEYIYYIMLLHSGVIRLKILHFFGYMWFWSLFKEGKKIVALDNPWTYLLKLADLWCARQFFTVFHQTSKYI